MWGVYVLESAVLPLPIETQHLRIRAPAKEDMESWVSLYANPNVLTYMGKPIERAAETWWLGLQERMTSVELPLTVAEKTLDRCVGQAGFLRVTESIKSGLEIYCRLLPEVWGKGYGGEVCSALISIALVDLEATKVIGYVHPENAASHAMLRRLGFRHAGTRLDPGGWQNGHEVYEKTAVGET